MRPHPEPPDEEPWEDFVARLHRTAPPVRRVAVGVGPNGVRRVGVYDPITRRYNIRDEE